MAVIDPATDRWSNRPATNSPGFVPWLILRAVDDLHQIALAAPQVVAHLAGIDEAMTSISQSLGENLELHVSEIAVEIAKCRDHADGVLKIIPIIGRRHQRHQAA